MHEVARRELRWWVVRREIGLAAGDEAGEAITALYSALYGVPESRVAEAGRLRGRAAEVRDRGAAADPDGPKGDGRAYWPQVRTAARLVSQPPGRLLHRHRVVVRVQDGLDHGREARHGLAIEYSEDHARSSQLTETVNVTAGTELVQTTSTVVLMISSAEIKNLPLVTRNALNFVPFLPGVDTSTIQRSSSVNGLPQSTLNITIDGVNIQDNFNKTTDGFFALIRPQLDAVEEVTVTGATPGANTAGQGGVQIAFTTKSGTNKLQGNGYYYLRQPSFNTNYYFNKVAGLPKNEVTVKQMGATLGGPIVIPGLFDGHNKAFFFENFEEFRQPTAATRTRVVASPLARAGFFQYTGGPAGGVNLMALAAANGQVAAFDPDDPGLHRHRQRDRNDGRLGPCPTSTT